MTLFVNRGSVIDGIAISNCPVKNPVGCVPNRGMPETERPRVATSGSLPALSEVTAGEAASVRVAVVFVFLLGGRPIVEIWGGRRGGASIPGNRCGVTVSARGARSVAIGNPQGARMTIKVGDTIPYMKLMVASADGPKEVATDDLFKGKKVVLFAVPGAFTPTCSAKHLPGFVANAEAMLAKGADSIVCMAVNDPFVMGAWSRDQGVDGKITMLADGSASFTKAMGLELDLVARGLGVRSQRFALIADDGKVTYLAVEPPGGFDVSRAEAVMAHL